MVNKLVFSSKKKVKKANTTNKAGGRAYKLDDQSALAQYAVTGTFNGSFYTSAQTQFTEALRLAKAVPVEFLAKLAVYSRKEGFMKDMPAFLVAVLLTRDTELFKTVFPHVIDNGKMLRNFVQIMRSGAVGRKSLGSAAKKAIQRWFKNQSDDYIFKASVGNSPSIGDVIKMVHPRPETESRDYLYAYLAGRWDEDYPLDTLPKLVQDFEAFKLKQPGNRRVPNVPFQMLTSQNLSKAEWKKIAKNGNWHFTRMNLNTFKRHEVFEDPKMVDLIAKRLADPELVRKSRVFPMQLFAANQYTHDLPKKIQNALHKAMEASIENIPDFDGKKVIVAVDASGSMMAPATGHRPGATSVVSCKDAAALFAAALVRKNPETEVCEFTTVASWVDVSPYDSVFTTQSKIGNISGGTDLGSPMRLINSSGKKADLVIILSDMQSWANQSYYCGGTNLQREWEKFRRNNKNAQLVGVNLVHGSTAQATNRADVLNVGGFSDRVFTVVSAFAEAQGNPLFWVEKIEEYVDLG